MASRSLPTKTKWQPGRQGSLVLAVCVEGSAWHDLVSVNKYRYFFLFGKTAFTEMDQGLQGLEARLLNVELPMLENLPTDTGEYNCHDLFIFEMSCCWCPLVQRNLDRDTALCLLCHSRCQSLHCTLKQTYCEQHWKQSREGWATHVEAVKVILSGTSHIL